MLRATIGCGKSASLGARAWSMSQSRAGSWQLAVKGTSRLSAHLPFRKPA